MSKIDKFLKKQEQSRKLLFEIIATVARNKYSSVDIGTLKKIEFSQNSITTELELQAIVDNWAELSSATSLEEFKMLVKQLYNSLDLPALPTPEKTKVSLSCSNSEKIQKIVKKLKDAKADYEEFINEKGYHGVEMFEEDKKKLRIRF